MLIMITNSNVPYCYDIAHVLGLPSNLSHRFRYRDKWIRLKRDIKNMKGQNGLIVFRDFDSGELIPLRYIEVQEILKVGEINYMEFQLKDYIPAERKKIISGKIDNELKEKGFVNKKGDDLECLVFELDEKLDCKPDKQEIESVLGQWNSILEDIGKFNCYHTCPK